MNAEMIDDLTRIDPRELEDFQEEMADIMREEAKRLEEERKRMDALLSAFRL